MVVSLKRRKTRSSNKKPQILSHYKHYKTHKSERTHTAYTQNSSLYLSSVLFQTWSSDFEGPRPIFPNRNSHI